MVIGRHNLPARLVFGPRYSEKGGVLCHREEEALYFLSRTGGSSDVPQVGWKIMLRSMFFKVNTSFSRLRLKR